MRAKREIEVSTLGADQYSEWDSFVREQATTGSIYSTACYLETLCRGGGGSFSIVAARGAGGILGGAALYFERELGHTLARNRLLLYYNGLVLKESLVDNGASDLSAVVEALREALEAAPCAALTLHNRGGAAVDWRGLLANGWAVEPTYTLVAPLTDIDLLWRRLDKNARRLVRRAQEAGLSGEIDNDGAALYQLHLETHERKGAPLYLGRPQFESYVENIVAAGLGSVVTARLPDGTPAAAQLVLHGPHPGSHTVCAGAAEKHLQSGAAYLLRWRAFEELAKLGYRDNDLTDAALGPVTRFKQQLGADLVMNLAAHSPQSLSYRLARQARSGCSAIKSRIARSLRGRNS